MGLKDPKLSLVLQLMSDNPLVFHFTEYARFNLQIPTHLQLNCEELGSHCGFQSWEASCVPFLGRKPSSFSSLEMKEMHF